MSEKLTAKQEKFAQCVFDGMTQVDAYREAYGGENATAKTLQENASRLAKNSKVLARVAQLRQQVEEKALWTRLDSVQALADIARGGEARANEKVAAIKELNAMHGFNAPQKIEHAGAIGVASLDVSKLGNDVLLAIMAAKDAAK